MTLYSAALFVHIVGVLLLSTAFTVEGIGLWLMRRGAPDWRRIAGLSRVFGPASVVAILLPGLYMMLSTWGWTAWIAVSLVTWLLIALLGALNGIRLSRRSAVSPTSLLANAELPVSWTTRIALVLAVVLLMVVKAGLLASLLVVAVCAALGVAAGLLLHAAPRARRGAGRAGGDQYRQSRAGSP